MHNTLYNIEKPPSASCQLAQYTKLLMNISLLLSVSSDILFKYIYEEDINIFNFTLLHVKIVIGVELFIDALLSIIHVNPEFSWRYLLLIYMCRFTKSFLYNFSQWETVLIMIILPLSILEVIHSYLSLYLNNEKLIKLRMHCFWILLPLKYLGEAMCIYYIFHDSIAVNFSLYFYLLINFCIELYDNYLVSNRILIDNEKYKTTKAKQTEQLNIKKKQ